MPHESQAWLNRQQKRATCLVFATLLQKRLE